jgi:alkyl hydroperoxide reductase subunit AhpC
VLEPDGSCRRGTFVIDPEGIVRHAAVSDGSVGRSGAETLRVVRALRTGELCPGQPYLLAA